MGVKSKMEVEKLLKEYNEVCEKLDQLNDRAYQLEWVLGERITKWKVEQEGAKEAPELECDEGEDEGLKEIREHEECIDLSSEEEDYVIESGMEKIREERGLR